MSVTYIVAEVAGQRIALAAASVEAIVDIGAIAPVPCAPPHVAGLCALRSSVMTVIDVLPATANAERQNARRAAVIVHDGHRYALRLDRVADVETVTASPQPSDASIGLDWLSIAPARLETVSGMALLLDIGRVVVGEGGMTRH